MMSEKRSAVQSEKGFTLLEMMVAVTLVVMMALGIWSIFRTSLRAWSRGTEYIDASQRQRNILDMVRKQIASAYPLTAPPDPASPVPVNPIFHGTETSLYFISLNSLRFHDSPGLTLVNYEVAQDLQGAYTLQEREERYLGQIPDTESEMDLPGATPLFGNLIQCYFEYRSNDDNEDPWVREWDARERGQLPEAVAVTMASTDIDGVTRNHHMIVPIHATKGTLQMNILNRGAIRQLMQGGRIPGRGTGRDLELDIEDRFEGRFENMPGRGSGRGPGRGPGRGSAGGPEQELDERFQDLLRRRLEREQRR
ncbi:MAG: prepilin-type N-terminal cleavage/methylation domain-containing protein [Acidobacteria bacterium]|nr:prepilin-type N-terminal cleavage/methylation domain-containing protein [Acidobacteriota bacterium]